LLLLFFNFCHKNLHIFALPSSAVLKPAQAGLVEPEVPQKVSIMSKYLDKSQKILTNLENLNSLDLP